MGIYISYGKGEQYAKIYEQGDCHIGDRSYADGKASAVSAKELYDARHVCTDVEAGGLDAAVQDAVKQKVIEYNAKDLEVVTRWGAEDATDEEGNYKVTFLKQYSQIFYRIPAEVDVNKLVSVEVRRMRNTFQ